MSPQDVSSTSSPIKIRSVSLTVPDFELNMASVKRILVLEGIQRHSGARKYFEFTMEELGYTFGKYSSSSLVLSFIER